MTIAGGIPSTTGLITNAVFDLATHPDQHRHVPIAAIGRRWGFSDAAHFSRLFRSTYGRSPREYRHDSVLAE
ncbi:helix-turn-helix domain-containing protein [Amycolatopsis sp. NPDC051373]|uniref:helix-turn-helix domain-containing protein n=1 Tax=Amycolatopsis sp. NPDC051373 TaxID=3155801 RepID=UPI00344FC1EC